MRSALSSTDDDDDNGVGALDDGAAENIAGAEQEEQTGHGRRRRRCGRPGRDDEKGKGEAMWPARGRRTAWTGGGSQRTRKARLLTRFLS